MRACREWRVAPSVFLSWPEDDQDKVIGFLREEGRCCPRCATHPDEWAEDRYAYVADEHYCPGCELISQAQRAIHENAAGVRPVLIPREAFIARQQQQEAGDGDRGVDT